MKPPAFALARLSRLTYLRFRLDHQAQTATPLNVGPVEAAHSSANGAWITADIEPYADVRDRDQLAGLTLRLQGHPFNGKTTYTIV